jgi:LmbE family N-acetylglucosaminyl deacetylase
MIENRRGVEYGRNLSILRKYFPQLAEKIERTESYTCKTIFLESKNLQDVERKIEKHELSKNSVWLFLGLGYHLFTLYEKVKGKGFFIVVERRLDRFKNSLYVFDWSSLLPTERVELIIEEQIDEVERIIKHKYMSIIFRWGLKVIKHEDSIKLHPDYYASIERSDFVKLGLKDWKYRSKIETQRFFAYHNFYKNKTPLITLLKKPLGSRILVLAPHPDDDLIGCGGTLLKHNKAGDEITVIYLTQSQKYCERTQEAIKALGIIGVSKYFFLNYEENALHLTPSIVEEIRGVIQKVVPNIIYLPFFLERSFDHRETNRIFIEAANSFEGPLQCYAYEVWGKLYPNRIVEITEEMHLKIKALSFHKTQVREFNCIDMTMKLNSKRASMILKKNGYAECFYYANLKDYINLYKQIYKL